MKHYIIIYDLMLVKRIRNKLYVTHSIKCGDMSSYRKTMPMKQLKFGEGIKCPGAVIMELHLGTRTR